MKENRLEKTEKILNLARNGKGLRKFVSETLPEIRKAMRYEKETPQSRVPMFDHAHLCNSNPITVNQPLMLAGSRNTQRLHRLAQSKTESI